MSRYIAKPTDPPQVWDSLKERVTSTHIDFTGAVNRAYILNAFSTGVYAQKPGQA